MRITFIFLLVCTFTSFLCAESLELRMLQLESKLVKQEERIEKLEKENGDFRKQIYALEQSQSVSESGNKGKMSGSKTVEDLS
ncbi:MAG: hypothetical protein HRU15_13200, partial [Planctomycetes bacterium]|nr:hypothetical protein [Planctomycetota bacterium]